MTKLSEPDHLPIEAQQYKKAIRKDSASYPGNQCTNCGARRFHMHQKRSRWFLVVVDSIVYPILSELCRWLCVGCGKTFTYYPALCLAFKYYLRPQIEQRSGSYVEEDLMTYRKVVKDRGGAVVYEGEIANAQSSEAEKEAEWTQQLAASTVYRWISSIANWRDRLKVVVERAQQQKPRGWLGQFMIPAWKYHSKARKKVLETCRLLLRAMKTVSIRNPSECATPGQSP